MVILAFVPTAVHPSPLNNDLQKSPVASFSLGVGRLQLYMRKCIIKVFQYKEREPDHDSTMSRMFRGV